MRPEKVHPSLSLVQYYQHVSSTLELCMEKEVESEVIKLFSCSTQLGMNFTLPMIVKMPTLLGINLNIYL